MVKIATTKCGARIYFQVPVMTSTSDALIAIADDILARIDHLSAVQISKKGRKYKFVNNNFQRVREEDKHLIVYPEDLDQQLSTILAYNILLNVAEDIFEAHRDLCLSIVGAARELEVNGWYEEENSSVINYKVLKFTYEEHEREKALEFANEVTPEHLEKAFTLLYCAKLNFLHTDHHIGTKLEGLHIRYYVEEFYGPEALDLSSVLVALKSFVHWANIKGVLHKLEVPNIDLEPEVVAKFASFPDPPEELRSHVYDRYPSGTSKYSLMRKAVDILADFHYSKLVPYPQQSEFELNWLFELCHNIESDPAKYHLRSVAKRLSKDPVNLNELSHQHAKKSKSLLSYISLVLNVFNDTGGEFLLQNSKIPHFSDELIEQWAELYKELVNVSNNIDEYEMKCWDEEDIVSRLYDESTPNLFDEVCKMRDLYADDYE